MDDMPPVRYAKSGEVHIAYMSDGPGPEEIVVTPGATSHLESTWEAVRARDRTQLGRFTWFDKRGTGLSDHDANFTLEERADDIRAVMDAQGIEKAHLQGISEGGPMSVMFAALHPDRVQSLLLTGTFASWRRQIDYPGGFPMTFNQYRHFVDRVEAAFRGDPEAMHWLVEMFAPSFADDAGFRDAFHRGMMRSASPRAGRAIWELLYDIDVRHLLPSLRLPVAVVHQTGDLVCPIAGARYVADHIPGARMIEVAGQDHAVPSAEYISAIDAALLENIQLARERPPAEDDRRLATVLFTDIVDSTPAAARAGDRAWRETLDRHDGAAKRVVEAHGGRLVKSTGDGLLATFDGPSRAVRAASALHAALGELGIPIRAGLHAGEIEVRGDDIAGMAVHIAARVSGLAGAGETLVSSTVKDLVVGAGFTFAERGEQALKGIDQPWRIYALASA